MNPRSDAAPPRPSTPRPQPGPRPSSPRPRGGHLPIGADQPALTDLLTSANLLGAPLLSLLRRGFDPATRPAERGPELVADVDMLLRHAAADVSSALLMLSRLAELLPQTTGSPTGERLSPGCAVALDPAATGGSGRVFSGTRPQANYVGPAPARVAASSVVAAEASGTPPRPGAGALPRRERVAVRPVGPVVWPGTAELAERINASLRWSR